MFKLLLISALLFFLGYGIFSFIFDKFGGRNQQRKSTQFQQEQKNTHAEKKKKIPKDLGEYVDYEEVKDDELLSR